MTGFGGPGDDVRIDSAARATPPASHSEAATKLQRFQILDQVALVVRRQIGAVIVPGI